MRIAIAAGAILGILLSMTPQPAAAEGTLPLKHPHITTDKKTLQEGLHVFVNVCMGCHSAKYVTYGDLMRYPQIGLTRKQVDAIRGSKSLLAGLTTDLSPADAKMSYGKVPPDLSVITLSRQGPDYVYSILTGFAHDPSGHIPDGNYNRYFPGNNIAMPDPLGWFFLAFVAEPHQLQRRSIGRWVIAFLVLLTLVLWLLKREVWKDVKH